jgi:hypothetical protein
MAEKELAQQKHPEQTEPAERSAQRDYSLNRMLQGDNAADQLYDDDYHYDNASSDGSSTESEGGPLVEYQQSPLQTIDAFLTSGNAFAQLKANITSLLHPPSTFEDALATKSVFVVKQYISRNPTRMSSDARDTVLAMRANRQSNMKIAEVLLDRTPGPQLVTWTCTCGMELHDYFTEILPGSVEKLQQHLRKENPPSSGSWYAFGVHWSLEDRQVRKTLAIQEIWSMLHPRHRQLLQS